MNVLLAMITVLLAQVMNKTAFPAFLDITWIAIILHASHALPLVYPVPVTTVVCLVT
jgi:hypothetical protein